jgi:fumarate reductase subunit D
MNKPNATNSPSNLDSKNDNPCSIKFRKIWADIYLIPPVFFQIYAILIPFVFVPGSRLGIERIQILNSFFISIISIMLPSIIAIWSFTYTKRYYDNDTLKWLLFGVSTPIVFVFFFLAITSKFYSQFSERVIFESNLGFYQTQFINEQNLSKKHHKNISKIFCLFATDLSKYYIFPIKKN